MLPGGSRIIQNQYMFNMSLYIVHLACLSQNCTLCGDETSTLVQVDAKPPAHSNHPPSHIFPPSGANSFITAHYRDPQGLGISFYLHCETVSSKSARERRQDGTPHQESQRESRYLQSTVTNTRQFGAYVLCVQSTLYRYMSTLLPLLLAPCSVFFLEGALLQPNTPFSERWEYFIQVTLILNK